MLKELNNAMADPKRFLIRDYREGDFPDIKNIWNETGMGGEERGDSPDSIRDCLAIGGKFLILTDRKNDTLIGTSWMTFDGRRIFLHHFGIKPEYQGIGLGKMLADASLKSVSSSAGRGPAES